MTPKELNERFGVDGAAAFVAGAGGLTRLDITAAEGEAQVSLQGAHVTAWRPRGAADVLWMSEKSWFEPGKPLRGGVPVCWPWFGPKEGDAVAPAHGFARLAEWQVESLRRQAGGDVSVCLLLKGAKGQWPGFPHAFELRHRVRVGRTLTMALETRNAGGEAFTLAEALHTYFRVSDVRNVAISGLAGVEFIDKMDGAKRKRQGVEPIRFAGETDRVYVNAAGECVLEDAGAGRRIVVAKSGSNSTVVWNPWIAKAARMADFGDNEWPGMVCIETANAADNVVTLAPGESHTMEARISA